MEFVASLFWKTKLSSAVANEILSGQSIYGCPEHSFILAAIEEWEWRAYLKQWRLEETKNYLVISLAKHCTGDWCLLYSQAPEVELVLVIGWML